MTMRCHCVSSRFWPSLSVNFSVVAMLTVATGVPPAVNRISASRPRLPTRIALFTLPMLRSVLRGTALVALPDRARLGFDAETVERLPRLRGRGRVLEPRDQRLVGRDRV